MIASGAFSQDAALLLGNERYEQLDRVARADDVLRARPGLEDLGFEVSALRNGRADTTHEAVAQFVASAEDAERIVVVVSGHFVTDGMRTWLLTSDAATPSLFSIAQTAVSIESLLHVLSTAPGQSLLVLGPDSVGGAALDPWLRYGLGALDIPQGVTVVRGQPRDVVEFSTEALTEPGLDIAAELPEWRSLRGEGYLPRTWILMPIEEPMPEPEAEPEDQSANEDAMWQGAVALDTVAAYRSYIRAFPNGRFVNEAEEVIEDILTEPHRNARKAEEALSLTRNQRQEIQRDLSLLDYDTRGIDGIFGPGSRRAITNWQQENGYPQTSYLTAEQISRLDAQASRRAAELEAEAERQRAEEARLDRAYWEETGASGDEPGYRAYLGRYPDGLYSEIATERLAEIEAAKRAEADSADREAWDRAVEANTVQSYQSYLGIWPDGAFRDEARARITALESESQNADVIERARAEEERLGLNPLTARLVEARLEQLGLNPGRVDGRFDDRTRRALRRYQQARNLPVTGYLNEATIVRLLADSVRINSR